MFAQRRNLGVVAALVGALALTLALTVLSSSRGSAQEFGASDGAGTGTETGTAPDLSGPEGKQYVTGQLIIKIKKEANLGDLRTINRRNDARLKEEIPQTDVSVVDLPKDLPVQEAVKLYDKSPDIAYVQPDYALYPTATPRDPYYKKMYNLNNTGQTGGTRDADIDAPQAWSITPGRHSTVVAVIDSGVDISHPDLRNNIWTNPGESGKDSRGRNKATNGVDDDRNGYVDDVHGWDFFHNNNSVYDRGDGDEHGTHVAGTIAAQGNNGIGVTGVNWHARIMPLKFIGASYGTSSGAIKAIDYAIKKGVKISNNSYGGAGYEPAMRDAVARANKAGLLFVAAAGNKGVNNDTKPDYPSSYDLPNVISVAATGAKDGLASFSNYGAKTVDVAAPGVNILSTLPGGRYGYYNGTSMASPHVAGVAALIKSRHPAYGAGTIRAQILRYADKKAKLRGKVATAGRVSAWASLMQAHPDTIRPAINTLYPRPSSRVKDRTPTVRATVRDNRTDLRKRQIRLYVDGTKRTRFTYDRRRDRLRYTTPKLSLGRHVVKIVARDGAGNYARRSWAFKVVRR